MNVREFRRDLSKWFTAADGGEEVVVSRRGKKYRLVGLVYDDDGKISFKLSEDK
jgi:antitoxin (DNA-binding transcriptional repressor) of toxin-antitoxin stability system